jgi:hypothetical protein
MNILTEAHKTLLNELLNCGIEFLLIGGYAVNFHGYPRYTIDMDIWLKPDNVNKDHFVEFLKKKGFDTESIDQIFILDFGEAQSFHIGNNETRVDFLTKISGVKFEEAYRQREMLSLPGKDIPVIPCRYLIINKMLSGRPKDMADIDELQKIMKLKKPKKNL